MSLVSNIKSLCEEKGINIDTLGTELEIGAKAIYKWDKSSPSIGNIIKVADYFNVTVDYLLGRTLVTKEEYINKKPDHNKYILLGEMAMEKGLPVEVLEKLIDLYAKK